MTTPTLFAAPRDAAPVVERLEWLTDVQVSRNGTEVRRARRAHPRHTYSYSVVMPTPAARAALEQLRADHTFLVPLWAHAFERPDTTPTAGLQAGTTGPLVALNHRGQGEVVEGTLAWPAWADLAAPAAVAWYASDQRTFQHATGAVAKAGVSFRLIDFAESVSGYSGPTSGGLPLLNFFVERASGFAEAIDVNSIAFDNGLLDLWEARYTKRTYSAQVLLRSRSEILAFRRLLFALRGRKNPLRWKAPHDPTEHTWRLASDAVEIEYLRPNLARCSISLTQLD